MQVAVLGGGYAGVTLGRALEGRLPPAVDITLIDETGHHLIQHELHRLVRFPELVSEISIPLTDLFDRATVRETTVREVDVEAGIVVDEDGRSMDPDIVAVCLGGVTAHGGVPGAREYGIPLKRIADAREIRRRAQSLADGARIVIAGAGLSGIQVAGELAAMDACAAGIELVEQAENVAPQHPTAFQRAVRDALVAVDVEVTTGATIEAVTTESVELATGAYRPADLVVWTGGITGPEAIAGTRHRVRADLRAASGTFVLGDAALVVDDRGDIVPAAAQTAVRQAQVAARNITRLLDHDETTQVFEPRLDRYRYESPGWVVSVGDQSVGMIGDEILRGRAARAIKTSVNATYYGTIGELERAATAIASSIGWSPAGSPRSE